MIRFSTGRIIPHLTVCALVAQVDNWERRDRKNRHLCVLLAEAMPGAMRFCNRPRTVIKNLRKHRR